MAGRGVIFDMDGVLVDSYGPHFESWKRMLHAHGLEMTEEQFAPTFGWTSREIIRRFWSDRVRDDREVAQWDAQKEQAYREILRECFPAMDGAPELLASLHAEGFKLAVGSSGPPANVEVVLQCLPNAGLFDATANGSEVHRGKPAPDVFLLAARKLGLEPSCCVVVEDAPDGIAAGKSAGMAVVAITGTAPRDKLSAANVIVGSLRQITPKMLDDLLAWER